MSKPDWEAIETAYRAGVMSLREIASQHGISEGAIVNERQKAWYYAKEKTLGDDMKREYSKGRRAALDNDRLLEGI